MSRAGLSCTSRWDCGASAHRPGPTRGGGTVPTPRCSSCFVCQPTLLPLPCVPMGLTQGSPSNCLAITLSSSPPSWQGRGEHRKPPHLVLIGKGAALPLPRAAALPSCCPGQPCTPVRPSPQLAGAFDLPLQEGQRIGSRGHSAPGASPTSPVCAEPFEAVLSSAAERGGHGLCLLSSKEPAAKIPPWALHVPQELAGVLFYSHFLCLPLKKNLCAMGAGAGTPMGSTGSHQEPKAGASSAGL